MYLPRRNFDGVPTAPRAMRAHAAHGPNRAVVWSDDARNAGTNAVALGDFSFGRPTLTGLTSSSRANTYDARRPASRSVTGPATAQQAAHRSGELYYPREVTHSNSNKWVSKWSANHSEFTRVRERATKFGFSNSPFFPQSDREFVDHKLDAITLRVAEFNRQINNKGAVKEGTKASKRHKYTTEHQKVLALAVAQTTDGLSTVLGAESCFNRRTRPTPVHERVLWPSAINFKTDAERNHTAGHPQQLPPPRINRPDPEKYDHRVPSSDWEGQHIPYEQREAVGPRWDWSRTPLLDTMGDDEEETVELGLDDINLSMVRLIKEMDDAFNNDTASLPNGDHGGPRRPDSDFRNGGASREAENEAPSNGERAVDFPHDKNTLSWSLRDLRLAKEGREAPIRGLQP